MSENITCLAIGDPHFKVTNVTDCEELIVKVCALIDERKPTFVVLLGDTLDTHEKIHVVPFRLATRLITSIAKRCLVFLLIGNHDYCNNSQFLTDAHPFNSFKKVPNVVVCDKPVAREFGADGMKFVMCPYVPPDRLVEALDTLLTTKGIEWRDARCIFAHQEFYGCSYNPVMTSTEGDVWSEDYPLVVSGHIHVEQRLQPNIYYPGSSMQHAFGDSGEKIVAMLTFKPGSKFKIERVNLGLKLRKIVRLGVHEISKYVHNPAVYTKLVLTGRSEEFKTFRASKKYKELQALGVSVSFTKTAEGDGSGNGKSTPDHPDSQPPKRHVLAILQDLITNENEYVKDAYSRLLALHK